MKPASIAAAVSLSTDCALMSFVSDGPIAAVARKPPIVPHSRPERTSSMSPALGLFASATSTPIDAAATPVATVAPTIPLSLKSSPPAHSAPLNEP